MGYSCVWFGAPIMDKVSGLIFIITSKHVQIKKK